jgi:hypothetical protein
LLHAGDLKGYQAAATGANRPLVMPPGDKIVKLARQIGKLGLAACTVALAGCASLDSRPNVGPCPVAGSLYEAARLVEVQGPERHENVGFTAEIENVKGYCRYVGDNPITMELDIDFAYGRGPKASGEARAYPYFVAVTRRDRAVLARQTYSEQVRFGRNETVVRKRVRVEGIVIPRASETVSGTNFEVIVGLELTPDQLAFNRAGKRFRMNVKD